MHKFKIIQRESNTIRLLTSHVGLKDNPYSGTRICKYHVQVVKGTMSDKHEDLLRQHRKNISDILALTIHSLCISILNNEQSYSPTDVTTEFPAHSKKDRRMNDLQN